MDCVNVATINVNGIRNRFKRKSFFRLLKQRNYDIILLQETNITNDVKCQWEREWNGQLFYSPGSNKRLGQITLFKKGFAFDGEVVFQSERILTVSCEMDIGKVNFVNVYAPNTSIEKRAFYDALHDHLDQLDGEIIVGGDFNCVLNNNIDIVSGDYHRAADSISFQALVTNTSLNDTWRLFHPDEKEFTWSRKTPFIARRLDYLLASDSIFAKTIECNIISAPHTDHRIVEMKYKLTTTVRGPSYWKFNDSLLLDIEFAKMMNLVIDQFIGDNSDLDPQLKWDLCKIQIREHCITYSTRKKHLHKNHMKTLQERLDVIDRQLSSNPYKANLQADKEIIKRELDIYAIHEARSAQVRSRTKFVEEGEKNTKYFLNLEKARANAKIMDRLKTSDGATVVNQHDILKEQTSFYSAIYKKKGDFNENKANDFIRGATIPHISDEQKSDLETELTLNEITRALSTMKNGSAPGPDGLTTSFLKFFWSKIAGLVMDSFNAAYLKGEMSTTQKQAVITLIHKGKDLPRDDLSSWRPISLTNTDYKLIAKSLALRLSGVLSDIIHENQRGFVKGRKASSMIRLIDDTVGLMNTLEKPGIMLAVDYARAFDSLSKEFMLWAFKQFGFGENFVKWVQVLTANTESSINYLGWISEGFPTECGIRQGCPFSPMGFIVALELLAIRIRFDNNVKGLDFPIPSFAVNPNTVLKILMYADDITLFLKDRDDLDRVLKLINDFSTFSNLLMNKNKTEAMWLGSNRNSDEKPFNLSWKTKLKILGIYFCSTTPASSLEENWAKRIQNIQRLIVSWSKRNLSISGKLCIIKTFLLSQMVYVMQALVIPQDVLKKINTMLFRFLWKKKYSNTRAFEKVKRKVLCNITENGGLNMIDMFAMQSSFLLSWAVQLQNSSGQIWSLIPNYLFSKLGVNLTCFLSDVSEQNFIGMFHVKSGFWKNVLTTWINNKVKLKADQTVYVNNCLWNNDCIKFKNRCLFFKDWIEVNICFVSDVVTNGEIIPFERLCDKVGRKPSRLFEYNALCTALRARAAQVIMNDPSVTPESCPPPPLPSSARNLRLKITEADTVQPCSVNFWHRKYDLTLTKSHWLIAQKSTKEERLRLLHWKILHNIYPTSILLHKMGIKHSKNCKYCDQVDYIEHFFWHCSKVKKIWEHSINFIKKHTGQAVSLSEKEVLMGYHPERHGEKITKLVNHIILITKMVISKFKYGTETDICTLFDIEVNIRKTFF
jgi:exonuclease III